MAKRRIGPQPIERLTKQQIERRRRVAVCLEMQQQGKTRRQIIAETGFSKDSVGRYLDESAEEGAAPAKKAPSKRNCLRCRKPFRPSSFGNFMCRSCNQFAAGAGI